MKRENDSLFSIAGEKFYFDLDRVSEYIKLDTNEDEIDKILKIEKKISKSDEESDKTEDVVDDDPMDEQFGQMIDITKWELTKVMIETVLSEHGIIDEAMGVTNLGTQLSIPFRISFNTLLINKILKKNG